MTYEGQLLFKQKQVKDVLERIGKLDLSNVTVHPTLGMQDPWNYRNKAQVPVGEREGGLVAGFYQQRSHDIIDMSACLIQQSKNDEAVQAVKDICANYGVKAYNEERHKGWLRHIMVRYGVVTGEMMIVFITRTNDFPHKAKIIEDITGSIPARQIHRAKHQPKQNKRHFWQRNKRHLGRRIHLRPHRRRQIRHLRQIVLSGQPRADKSALRQSA